MSTMSNAEASTLTETEVLTPATSQAPTLHLRCRKLKTKKCVKWTETTVDNEHMNKQKSKCCCQYVKPRKFGESSSESEEECENCPGHAAKKKSSENGN